MHQDPDSPFYRLRFRFNGRQANRSLRTSDRRAATAACVRIGEKLSLLERGLLSTPPDADRQTPKLRLRSPTDG